LVEKNFILKKGSEVTPPTNLYVHLASLEVEYS